MQVVCSRDNPGLHHIQDFYQNRSDLGLITGDIIYPNGEPWNYHYNYFYPYALFKRKANLLILIGFILVWLYGGWPLAILITSFDGAVNVIFEA